MIYVLVESLNINLLIFMWVVKLCRRVCVSIPILVILLFMKVLVTNTFENYII